MDVKNDMRDDSRKLEDNWREREWGLFLLFLPDGAVAVLVVAAVDEPSLM